ncbi:MAG: metallophosphoesterase family protein [Phycisphaerales bacterium]
MRTAVISDIHGDHGALVAVLKDIEACACDRIVCLGDIVNGGDANAACIRELQSRRILTIRENHDELFCQTRQGPDAEWLGALPESLLEVDVLFIHISPRRDDRAITDRFIAWNVIDDMRERIAFVGHLHVPVLYSVSRVMVGAARSGPVDYGRPIPLPREERHLVCPGSVGASRDGDPAARYAVYDDRGLVEFRRVAAR